MILKKFTNIYPRTLWIAVIEKEEDIDFLLKKFTIFKITPQFNKVDEEAEIKMKESCHDDTVAECLPCMLNSNYKLGVMCVIYKPSSFDSSVAAHEAVHISDYYFEITGMHGEDFSDGHNEGFAYLVGWVVTCFIKTMKEYGNTTGI